jgi:hypothetical protein
MGKKTFLWISIILVAAAIVATLVLHSTWEEPKIGLAPSTQEAQ